MNVEELNSVSYSIVPVFEKDDFSYIEEFHEYTKLNQENFHDLANRVSAITQSRKLRTMMTRSWKQYRGNPRVILPKAELGNMTVQEAIERRRSLSSLPGASFDAARPMTIEQISAILGFSYGVTHVHPLASGGAQYFRASASAGGLYPLEIYVVVYNVTGVEHGLYHYSPVEHELELVRSACPREEFVATTTYKELTSDCPVAFVISSIFRRNLSKYLNRGYRFIMHDVGTVLQSMYMTTTAVGLTGCAMTGFYDDELGKVLGINNVDEVALACFVAGHRNQSRP